MIAPNTSRAFDNAPDTVANVCDRAMAPRVQRRDQIEALVDAAKYFDPDDRALVEHVYHYGAPVAQVARLSSQPAPKLRRRLKRLVARINAPLFGFLVLYRDMIPQRARRSAELVVMRGYSLRRTVAATGKSLHRVREDMRVVRALARVD